VLAETINSADFADGFAEFGLGSSPRRSAE
jgi:hypothetical protein